jgi:phosphinothricin acetyltransferase
MPTIRPSRDDDIDAITAIYAHHVLHGTGTFEVDPPSKSRTCARAGPRCWRAVCRGWLPNPTARSAASPTATGSSPARPTGFRPKTRSTWRLDAATGNGLGRALLAELTTQAEARRRAQADRGDRRLGQHRLDRRASRSGLQHVGVLASCGWKFDRWLDVVLMERSLGLGDTTSPQ